MNKYRRILASIILVMSGIAFTSSVQGESDDRIMHVLYVTGGGWHDYDAQAPIVVQIIREALAEVGLNKVNITTSNVGHPRQDSRFERHPVFEREDWAEGFDLVVYNKCNAPRFSDDAWVERIVTPHREGLPAVLIHGTLHNFWPDEERTGLWNAFCGITSRNHERPGQKVTTHVRMPDHPIMNGLPEQWSHGKGELYRVHGMQEGVQVLAVGVSGEGVEHPILWTHQFGKGRVFGNSLGHATETFEGTEFQKVMRQGIQWAIGKLAE